VQENLELRPIQTSLDKLLTDLAQYSKGIKLSKLSKQLEVEKKSLLQWARILEKKNLLQISQSFLKGIILQPKTHDEVAQIIVSAQSGALESYPLSVHAISAIVSITKPTLKTRMRYILQIAPLGHATMALIEEAVEKFTQMMSLPSVPRRTGTQDQLEDLNEISKILSELVSTLTKDQLKILSGHVFLRVKGLLDLDIYLADDWIEELAINGSNEPMSVYHRKYGWLETDRRFQSEEEIYTIAAAVTRQAGREITLKRPLVDAPLRSGDRTIATLYPISAHGNTLTIRRFARNPWTIARLIKEGTISSELAALLWQAMQYEINILVTGSTASGKTSMLNALAGFFPDTQRILSIEDTREITLPDSVHWNWVPLVVRQENPEGKGEITMLELLANALRMRPDRILVGEVRRREQVLALFEAMNTGHAVYATMHADSADQVARRLVKPPLSIPSGEVQALQLIVVQHRDRRSGLRRTREIVEVLRLPGEDLKLNYLYRWLPRKDVFEDVSESIRIIEELNMHTGMTQMELLADRTEKTAILDWMVKHNILSLAKVGLVIAQYYRNPDSVMGIVKRDAAPENYSKVINKPAKKSVSHKNIRSSQKNFTSPKNRTLEIKKKSEEQSIMKKGRKLGRLLKSKKRSQRK